MLMLGASMALLSQSCSKGNDKPETPGNKPTTLLPDSACYRATYTDVWHYTTPQLYIFHGNQYARVDLLTHTYKGLNPISAGYPGVPFTSFDAVYANIWIDPMAPKLIIFSGKQVARYDIKSNTYLGLDSISHAYPGVTFTSIDAAYVDTVTYSTPQLYLFSGTQYARVDIPTNAFKGITDIASHYPGVPFSTFSATYVSTWFSTTNKLIIFSGTQHATYDIKANRFEGVTSNSADYPGVPFCQ